MTPETIVEAKAAGITGVKSYPAGVTTNSSSGVVDYTLFYPIFAQMEKEDMLLNLHGECPSKGDVTILNAESKFLPILSSLSQRFPKLRICLEHLTTAEAVETVAKLGPTVAGTITAHHLYLIVDDWAGNSINYCKPVAKTVADRAALLHAAISRNRKFFFGSDSAPHPMTSKRGADKVAAGVFTQPYTTQLVLDSLQRGIQMGILREQDVTLEKLKGFMSENGRAFYGLPKESGEEIELTREHEKIMSVLENHDESVQVLPFRTGESNEEAGGFLPPTLLSPPASAFNSPPPAHRSILPSPRTKPLKPGSSKESDLINHVETKLLAISRRYENRFSAALGEEENPEIEGRGYKDIGEEIRDLDPVIDIVWISGTPSLQITFLLTIALTVTTSLPSFPFTPRPTFQILRKLDLAFASLLKGINVETGEALPGFGGGRGNISTTEKVRMRGIIERTRIVVVEVAGKDGSLAGTASVHQSQTDTEDDFNMTEDTEIDDLEDESSHRRWEMDIARVYEKAIVELGLALDTSSSNGRGWQP
ncbi:MAG: hypothetical protein Q9222_003645 [Ikaeria aurantiellina]